MTKNENTDEVSDLIAGLPSIAKLVGVSVEGVRYLWAEGRLPVVRIGSIWLANKSALLKAAENDAIRIKRGRKRKIPRNA